MVVNQYKLVNDSNTTGLKFHWAEQTQDSISVNNVNFAVPGLDSSNNYASNLGGFDRLITVDFVLYNDGTDKSTDASSKVTLSQQWDHLMDTVVQGVGGSDDQSDVLFTLTIYRDGATKTFTGIVDGISLGANPGRSGTSINGSLTFIIGTS